MQAYTSPRRFLGNSKLLLLCLGVAVAAAIVITGFFWNRNNISIYVDGKEFAVVVRGGTVADAIKEAKIPLGEKDIVEPSLKTATSNHLKVRVTRLVKVNIAADGSTEQHWVQLGTVEQTLKKLNIALNSDDKVNPDLGKRISAGDTIEVIRFSQKYIRLSSSIPYEVEQRKDQTMERGAKRIIREGEKGLLQRTVKITLKNGKEISREVVAQKIVKEPVKKILAIGTLRTKPVSRGGSIKFSRVIKMSSTAYTDTGHRTASGIYPYKGAVAVDPRVIPLGTKLYIEGYGYAKALDIGSAIKGNKIDVFFETGKDARRWGRRSVNVYILE